MTAQSSFFSFPRLDRAGGSGIPSSIEEPKNRRGDSLELSALLAQENSVGRGLKAREEGAASASSVERQYWLSDELCKECYSCERPFYMLRRKHHCRVCGRIFCSSCSAYSVSGKPYGYSQSTVRACKDCFEIARDEVTEAQLAHRMPQPKLPQPSPLSKQEVNATDHPQSPNPNLNPNPNHRRKQLRAETPAGRHSVDIVGASRASERLMYRRPISRLRIRLTKRSKSMDSLQAAANTDSSGIEPEKYAAFCTRLLRKLYQKKIAEMLDAQSGEAKVLLSEERIMIWSRLLTALTMDACKRVRPRLSLLPSGDQSRSGNGTLAGASGVGNGNGGGGDSAKRDSMDISKYVKVICIPGGTAEDSLKINGIVCEKQLIHRKMKKRIAFPRIMALESSLEFAREESRMLSLETLYEQELQYMKLVIDKIASVGVDVLLVGKAVSRIGQELLLEAGISVAINMPLAMLKRIARLTGARVLPSVDHIIPSVNPTGTCKMWHVEKLQVNPSAEHLEELPESLRSAEQAATRSTRSFMFFEGCSPSAGTSVVLRGGATLTLDFLRRIFDDLVKKGYLLTLQQKLFADLSAKAVPGNEAKLLELLDKDSIPLWHVRTRGVLQTTLPEKVRYRFWEDAMDQPLGLFLLKRGAGFRTASAEALDRGVSHESVEESPGSLGSPSVTHAGSSGGHADGAGQEIAPAVAQSFTTTAVNLDDSMDYFSIFYIHGEHRLKVMFENLNVTKDAGLSAIREQLLALRRKIVAARVAESSMKRKGALGGSAQISSNFLLCWSACKICGRRTKVKALSRDAAYISYGKFIQMKLFDTSAHVQLPECNHLLFQDCITYFEYFGVVGSFEHEPNKVYSFKLCGNSSSHKFHQRWRDSYLSFRALKLEIALAHISKTFARRISKFTSHVNRVSGKEPTDPKAGTTDSSSIGMEKLNAATLAQCHSLANEIEGEVVTLRNLLATGELSLVSVTLLQRRLLLSITAWNHSFEDLQDKITVPKPTQAFANLVKLPEQWTKMVENDAVPRVEVAEVEVNAEDKETSKLRRHESDGSTKHLMPQVEVPAELNEGHPLLLSEQDPCPCLVFTQEPTSMIAQCLGSKAYQSALAEKTRSYTGKCEKLVEVLAIERTKQQEEVKVGFRDELSGVWFEVKVFHALKFEALRNPGGSLSGVPEGVEMDHILSLSRCDAWGASGGKTKAKFFKSRDQTLLAKTISIEELELFHASANKYFAHMHASITKKRPSAIMKILGIYTLSFAVASAESLAGDELLAATSTGTLRSEANGETAEDVQGLRKPNKMHLLVMRKLFVDDSVALRKFDLKGNYRNRYVQNPKPGDVLLDVNFFEVYNGVPITVEKEDKELLKQATAFDTKLFEQSGIVDYSLILGIPKEDEESGEIVLGIVDYLQLYNYRKMIESNVKQAGMIAGQLEPTVIGPTRYQLRFTKAMNRYFIAKLEDD